MEPHSEKEDVKFRYQEVVMRTMDDFARALFEAVEDAVRDKRLAVEDVDKALAVLETIKNETLEKK